MGFTVDHVVDTLGRTLFHDRWAPLILALVLSRSVKAVRDKALIPAAATTTRLSAIRAWLRDLVTALGERRWLAIYALIVSSKFLRTVLTPLLVDKAPKRKIRWRDEVVLITGGGRGICGTLAQKLSAKGAKVAILDVHEQSEHGKGYYVNCDITSDKALLAAREDIERRVGKVTMIVNGAGMGVLGPSLMPMEHCSGDEQTKPIDVNLTAIMRVNKCFGQNMLAKNKGHFFFMASGASWISLPYNAPYNASKTGVIALWETLSWELDCYYKKTGIRCSAFCPLKVESPLTTGNMADAPFQFVAPTMTMSQAADFVVKILQDDKSVFVLRPHVAWMMSWMRIMPLWAKRLMGNSLDLEVTFRDGSNRFVKEKAELQRNK